MNIFLVLNTAIATTETRERINSALGEAFQSIGNFGGVMRRGYVVTTNFLREQIEKLRQRQTTGLKMADTKLDESEKKNVERILDEAIKELHGADKEQDVKEIKEKIAEAQKSIDSEEISEAREEIL